MTIKNISIILPAKNEAESLKMLLPSIKNSFPDAEIIVVNDGSIDDTLSVCKIYEITCITHPYSKGNGSAIKTGARAAKGKTLAFLDADSQHTANDLKKLMDRCQTGYDMVVGARGIDSQANFARGAANGFYNRLASWMVEHPITDLTSGMRVVDAQKFRKFLYLLPNGFSYPTTITMAFFRAGYSVAYEPIKARKRVGKSHIRLMKDGLRFLIIIFKIGTLYSPLKLFTPISLFFFFTALSYYAYTYISFNRFTNMSALLFITSAFIFLGGLISEQITALNYKDKNE